MPIIIDGVTPSGQYPKVQFVDAPDTSANVRLDLNYGRWSNEDVWPGHDGFSIGAPTLEGDPGAVGVEYGFRQLTFNTVIRTTKVTAQRVMSAIAKELLRQDNWLLFQISANSSPVWFRTYRTSPGALDFELVQDTDDASTDVWGISVTLDADPFAYGTRVSVPAVTINNDPSGAPSTIAAPTISGSTTATSGGTLAAGTYYYQLTATTAAGETTASPTNSVTTTGSTSTVTLSWTAVSGATGYKVYRSNSGSGPFNLLATLGAGTSYTDTGSATPGTATPPTTNTATGAGSCSYWLPTISGDAPTPLVVQAGTARAGQLGLLAVTALPSRPSGYVAPFRVSEGGLVAGTDTAGAANDATYIGQTSQVVSFATNAALATRLSGSNITTVNGTQNMPLLPGTYRAFLRVGYGTSTASFQVRLGQQNGASSYTWNSTATVTADGTARKQYVDLGTIAHPFGNPVPEDSSYANYTMPGPSLAIQAGRPSGTGSLNLDDLILIPATLKDSETTMALVTMGLTIDPATAAIYDSENERVIMLTGATQFGTQQQATQVAGGFPVVTPGTANLLHYFPAMTSDDLTFATSLTMSYQPRYLYLGGS